MMMQRITTPAAFEHLLSLSQERPVLLFKHSMTCPTSASARYRVQQLDDSKDLPIFEVVVQEARAISAGIAQTLGVRHESPQVLLIYRGQVPYHASHGDIQTSAIRSALAAIRFT